MKITAIVRGVVVGVVASVLAGCGGMDTASTAKGAMSLFDQLGGMDQIKSLSDKFVNNVAADPRTSKLVAGADTTAAKAKVSNELCALTGGGCAAPLTEASCQPASCTIASSTSTPGRIGCSGKWNSR